MLGRMAFPDQLTLTCLALHVLAFIKAFYKLVLLEGLCNKTRQDLGSGRVHFFFILQMEKGRRKEEADGEQRKRKPLSQECQQQCHLIYPRSSNRRTLVRE